MSNPSNVEIGQQIVALSNEGKGEEAVERFYDEKVVSIEGQDAEAMPARMEGIEAVRQKGAWWYENHEIHESRATGPYAGLRDDQFVIRFNLDVTFKPSGERSAMEEVGLYTVKNGKIVQEEFLYLAE
jgi:hypothetical protein